MPVRDGSGVRRRCSIACSRIDRPSPPTIIFRRWNRRFPTTGIPDRGCWPGAPSRREAGDRLVVEIDVNDIDSDLMARARKYREGTWTRFWSHDWFLFLRSHLSLRAAPNFVFIDPPPGDARGPSYAIDAAILLETLKVPFMISYAADRAQEPIDEIGRTGLELVTLEDESGVLLGGGAEGLLLDILPDLRRLADLLGGTFRARLPRYDDYSI